MEKAIPFSNTLRTRPPHWPLHAHEEDIAKSRAASMPAG